MAQGKTLVCSGCKKSLHVWEDGNPYVTGPAGKKTFFHHPDPRMGEADGNAPDCVCNACGKRGRVDEHRLPKTCRTCKVGTLVPAWELEGKPCPWCKTGIIENSGVMIVS